MSEKEFYKNQESMRKPSLTNFIRLVQTIYGVKFRPSLLIPFSFLLFVGQTFGQTVTATYTCLDNQTAPGNGQYEVELCYSAPTGGTYNVTQFNHIYDPNYIGPAFPLTNFDSYPIPLVEGPVGMYCVTALMEENATGKMTINSGQIHTIGPSPKYPLDLIMGPTELCLGGGMIGNFMLSEADGLANYTWTVEDGSSTNIHTSGLTDKNFTFAFPAGVEDTYTVGVTGTDPYGCMHDATLLVETYDLSDRVSVEGEKEVVCGYTETYTVTGLSDPASSNTITSWGVYDLPLPGGALLTTTNGTQTVDPSTVSATFTFQDGAGTYYVRATGMNADGCTFVVECPVVVEEISDGVILQSAGNKLCQGGVVLLELYKDTLISYDNNAVWTVTNPGGFNPADVTPLDPNGCAVSIDLSNVPLTTDITVTVSGTHGATGCPFTDEIEIDVTDVADHWTIEGDKTPYCGDWVLYEVVADEANGFDLSCLTGPITPVAPLTNVWSVVEGGVDVTALYSPVVSPDFRTAQIQWSPVSTSANIEVVFAGQTADGCQFELRCQYIEVFPLSDLHITGDFYVCEDDQDFTEYCFALSETDLDPGMTYTLTDYFGNDVSSYLAVNVADRTKVTINWPAGAAANSPYNIKLTGNRDGGNCPFEAEKVIEVVDNPPAGQIACNNHVYITLNQACALIVTPDMILEGVDHPEEDRYDVTITDPSTGDVVTGPLDGDAVGNTYQVMVSEECSDNVCWGYITVEDKSIPQLVCPDGPFVIDCDEIGDMSLTGFPVFDVGVVVTPNGDDTWTVAGFDNCSNDALLTFDDALEASSCDPDEPGNTYRRTWTIMDGAGGSSSCSYLIEVTRPTDLTLVWPLSWDDNIAGANPSIDVCDVMTTDNPGGWPTDDNGNPHPDFTGYPTGLICLNLSIVGYDDVLEIEKCPGAKLSSPARKIIREWTVWDSCSGEDYSVNQIISLVDHDIPVLAPAFEVGGMTQDSEGYYLYDAHQYDCSDDVTLYPFPGSDKLGEFEGLIDECSDITIRVGYLVPIPGTPDPDLTQDFIMFPNEICDVDDSVTIPAVDGTAVWIRYEFEDACGNVAIATAQNNLDPITGLPIFPGVSSFEIRFNDVTDPQPVCDVFSVVALDDMCMAFARPETFDDGSYDNCELDYMKVIREDDANGAFTWQDEVKFDASDIGDGTVGVYLGVWDAAGNSSSCLVQVTVENPNPTAVDCPDVSRTVDCEASWLDNLNLGTTSPSIIQSNASVIPSSFGSPSILNPSNLACIGGTVTENAPYVYYGECQITRIERSWTITYDNGAPSTQCLQTITVNNTTPFGLSNINWPADEVTVDCSASLDPSNPAIGEPSWTTEGCSNIISGYDDLPFQYVQGDADYCQKVVRTWTIKDWCNPSADFTHVQVIKIADNEDPSFLTGCADVKATGALDPATCQLLVSGLEATARDNCTATDDLVWSYVIEYDSATGLSDFNGNSNDASGVFPAGDHKVTYYVSDLCGNVESCMINVEVEDDVLPTPYCVDQVITVINSATAQAEIWAIDLDAGSYDNCFNNTDDVTVSFSPTPGDNVRFYDCDDLENGVVDTFEVRLYVIDADGNYDFCLTQIIVQDNSDVCPDVPDDTNGSGRIAGEVRTEEDEMIEEVMMHLHSTQPEFPMLDMSETGSYDFGDLTSNENYMVTPSKNDNHANGVSTLDIILIQRHLLNLENLDSPYKLIAADANNNAEVSAADLVEIRNLILENINEYQNNTSWRFINKEYTFTDEAHPFPFEEEVDVFDLPTSTIAVDFVGVKVGDVNGSVTLNGLASGDVDVRTSPLNITLVPTASQNGQVLIPVKASSDYTVAGLQFELDLPANVESIAEGILPISTDYYTTSENGVRVSWNATQNQSVKAGDVLFTLVLNSDKTIDASDVTLSQSFDNEVYQDNGGDIEIQNLQLANEADVADGFALYQNKPNPFSDETTFSFSLPKSQTATITVMEMTGKVLYALTDSYNKGYNEVIFNTTSVQTTGILYLKVETETHSAIRKMIIIQ